MIKRVLTTFRFQVKRFSGITQELPKYKAFNFHASFCSIKYVPAIQKFEEDPNPKTLENLILQMSAMNELNRKKSLSVIL